MAVSKLYFINTVSSDGRPLTSLPAGPGRLPDTTTVSRQPCTEKSLVTKTRFICYKIAGLVYYIVYVIENGFAPEIHSKVKSQQSVSREGPNG